MPEPESSMELSVRYATTADGVSVAWGEAGDGPALLHFQSTPFSHVQEAYALGGEGYRGLARSFRLIMFDARGTGLSERDVEEVSGATLLADVEAVIAAAKLDRFVVVTDMGSLSLSTGLQLAVALPEQISTLGLHRSGSEHKRARRYAVPKDWTGSGRGGLGCLRADDVSRPQRLRPI